MNGVDPIDLDRKCDLASVALALLVVPKGAHTSDEDVLDLVLTRPVQYECVFEARGQVRASVAGESTLGAGQRRVVGVAQRDDVTTDPPAGRRHDRLIRVGHDDGVPAG